MRAVAVAPDVVVVISGVWQTTCTLVRAGGEGFVIDSPILPDELQALPALCRQTGVPVSGLLATHGDWDHLLGRLAFPEASLGVGEQTLARLDAEPGAAQRELRRFDEEFYVTRESPLQLAGPQGLPVPGRLTLGEEAGQAARSGAQGDAPDTPRQEGGQPIEIHPAPGHTSDGCAFWLGWRGVLVCGDYLSPVEIPMLSRSGSATAYLETLAHLETLVERATTVVPGHGAPLDRDRAQRILEQDRLYLETLLDKGEAALPEGRSTAEQRRIDAANRASLSGG
jgi:glyoxylase-like metal-dependent hydrolase (beta-lactamase superfamily II)